MSETISAASKSKPKASTGATPFETPKFETPSFEMPKFEIPKMEVPAAFREFAEKGVTQAKANYEKMKSVAEDATEMLEDTYANASKGCSAHGLKLVETARINSNAAFDLWTELLSAKSYAEVVELTTGFFRKQFDTAIAQAKDLNEHAQKVATDTVEPIKEGFSSAFNKAA